MCEAGLYSIRYTRLDFYHLSVHNLHACSNLKCGPAMLTRYMYKAPSVIVLLYLPVQGTYTGLVTAVDQDDQELLCINISGMKVQ